MGKIMHNAEVTVCAAALIVDMWLCGLPAYQQDVICSYTLITDGVNEKRIIENWDNALNAAKFIAHATGLRIPPTPPTEGKQAA